MDVTIYLEPYAQTFILLREFIQTILAGSLFSDALELDPEATIIPIPNPVVTPAVMQFLVDYAQGREPDKHIPDLVSASRYFNLPWLLYYTDPLYDDIDTRNLNSVKSQDVLDRAIQDNHILVVGYFLMKGVKPTQEMLLDAIHNRSTEVAKLLLPQTTDINNEVLLTESVTSDFQPGVDFALSSGQIKYSDLELLQTAVLVDNPGILKSLLDIQKPIYFADIWLTPYDNAIKILLKLASAGGQLHSLDVLLTTDISPSFNQNIVLEEALEASPANIVDVTQHLQADPRFNPNLHLQTLLRMAALMDQAGVISALLQDPRTQLTPALLDSVITSLKGRVSLKILHQLESFQN